MSKDWFEVRGKVVIITGGAGMLGQEYARALSRAGAHAIIADVDEKAAKAVAASVKGAEAMAVRLDLTEPDSVQEMVQSVCASFGRIDALVNNAALDPKFDPAHHGRQRHRFEDYPLELWNESLMVNLTGMFLCTQAVAADMLERKYGVIVNISSIYGLVGPDQRLYQQKGGQPAYKPVTYSVTKSAVLGFTRYLATYWAGKGIRANTLTLGGVYNEHEEDFVQRYSWRTPLGRMAHKSEYCGALIFLLSDASAYMTGANLIVDGGWTAW